MRVVTEVELREKFRKSPFTTFNLARGCRLTPAAAQFLGERNIKVISEEDKEKRLQEAKIVDANTIQPQVQKPQEKIDKAFDTKTSIKSSLQRNDTIEIELEPGEKKPEHMTHLKGRTLVPKTHPRIKFRGKIDSVESILINLIIDVEKSGVIELAKDLRELLKYMANMMRAEVLDEELPPLSIRSWSEQDIHDFSHNPQRYFGVKHFMPNPDQGQLVAKLNYLRAQFRELEIIALEAFYSSPEQVEREDILQAVNRFSSLIYVMMIGLMSGHYKIGL